MQNERDIVRREQTPESPPYLGKIREEIIILREWMALLARDWRKFAGITCAIQMGDMTGVSRGLRAAYFFCRHIDDRVDGDRPGTEILETIDALRLQLQQGIPAGASEGILLQSAVRSVSTRCDGMEVRQCFTTFLDVMSADYRRRMENICLSQEALNAHYRHSFGCVHDIALMSLNSPHRTGDLAPLAELQGTVYGLRDMATELPRGEINIPNEALNATEMTPEDVIRHPDIWGIPALREWRSERCSWAKQMVERVDERAPKERAVQWIVRTLLPPIRRYLAKN